MTHMMGLPHQLATPALEDYGILNAKTHQVSGLPHAVGDGVTDDTVALQAILNYGYQNRLVTLLPSGVYLVSDTLNMVDENLHHNSDDYSFVLIGSTLGAKPVIKLKDQAPGFDDVELPKPIIKLWRKCGADEREDVRLCKEPNNLVDGEGQPGNYFSDGIRNFMVEVGYRNPGAVGVYFAAAQDSFIEDITVDMLKSGYAGFTAIPGPASVIGNLVVRGGDYGIKGYFMYNPVLTNIKLINQKVAAIETNAFPILTLVGFEIRKQRAPAIKITGGKGGLVLVDGKINISRNSDVAVVQLNNSSSTSSLTNVYFRNADQAVTVENDRVIGASGWQQLAEFYGKSATDSVAVINQVITQTTTYTPLVPVAREPEDLGRYHTWPRYRSPDHLLLLAARPNSGVCNALDANDEFAIQANSQADAQPGLQAMIDSDRCPTILLPKGDYFIGSTLTLGADTQLLGLAHSFTALTPSSQMSATRQLVEWLPTTEVDFITTVNDANATTMLADVRLKVPTRPKAHNWITALHWKAGKYSILKNVFTNSLWSAESQTNPKAEIRYSGQGGGKWFGAGAKGLPPANFPASPGYRKMMITGTTQPLFLYNLNIEDGAACPAGQSLTCPDTSWQAEIINSKNVVIFGAKFENQKALKIERSDNIGYFGTNVGSELGAYDNTNITMASVSNVKVAKMQAWVLKIKEDNYTTTISKDQYLAVYKRGNFDLNKIRVPLAGDLQPPTTLLPLP